MTTCTTIRDSLANLVAVMLEILSVLRTISGHLEALVEWKRVEVDEPTGNDAGSGADYSVSDWLAHLKEGVDGLEKIARRPRDDGGI